MSYPSKAQIQYVELPDDDINDSAETNIAQHQNTSIWDLIASLID